MEECVYYLRWSVTSDALLRRWHKAKRKTNRLAIPADVWRALSSEKAKYLETITKADDDYNEKGLEVEISCC